MIDLKISLATFRVTHVKTLSQGTFVIRTHKNDINFVPGQRVSINLRNDTVRRKYSIYSAKDDPYLEFLIREVPTGYLTPKLKPFVPGDELEIYGPNGHFTLEKIDKENSKLLFISTGTGIAPFHSMIRSYPEIDYQLVHGVRSAEEAYHFFDYGLKRLTVCVSGEESSFFHGRVTHYIDDMELSLFDHIFICGNRNMIDDVIRIAQNKGFPKERIHTEIYF